MMKTRSQMQNLSKEELVEELIKATDIADKLTNLTKTLDELNKNFDRVSSELAVVKNVNNLLSGKIVSLERELLETSQYLRRQMLELSPIPESIDDKSLEQVVCNALSLTDIPIDETLLDACHRMKNKSRAIIMFKSRKIRKKVIENRRILKDKSEQLKELGFKDSLYINESMCRGNSSTK